MAHRLLKHLLKSTLYFMGFFLKYRKINGQQREHNDVEQDELGHVIHGADSTNSISKEQSPIRNRHVEVHQ